MQLWILFAIGALVSWGAYGPAMAEGRANFPDKATAGWRAFLCVGIAYFLVAVLVPLFTLWSKGSLSGFSGKGVAYSTVGGVLGARGAVCIIWAFQNGGTPIRVMPLVFAGAPVVTAII